MNSRTGSGWDLVLEFFIVTASAFFLTKLEKNTTADVFINPDSPALVYRKTIEEVFGLTDPLVVAVVNENEGGIYNQDTLALVAWLTEEISKLENVDPDRVVSLAT